MANNLFISVLIFYIFFPCSGENQIKTLPGKGIIPVQVNEDIQFQTIHNFGASDAWSCQFVGNWPEDKKNRIADLLFSLEEKKDGSPKGIGLSCWRFNIGGGSTDQKGETKIGDPWRRAECFLQKDGSYNWEKQSGQRWFLRAAKERGVESFIGFVNSPPVWLTKNGRANSDEGNTVNLSKENIPKFSSFLVEVTRNIHKNEGVLFDYLAPVNEPQWDWKSGQEGCPWTNDEVAELSRLLGNDLENAGLSTKIEIPEAGKITHLFSRGNDAKRGYQISDFFSPESENYVGDIPNMAHKIAAHSYFTTTNNKVLNETRTLLQEEMERINPSLEYWMTEFCILGDNNGFKGNGRDLGMETALFVANVIHADLSIANSSVWQWWLAVSPYDFKDGLVYIDKSETGGEIYESKLLWTLGNYARFIRPGAKRISVETEANNELKISAFKNKNGDIVFVCINRGQENTKIQLNLSGKAGLYETSSGKNLRFKGEFEVKNPIELPKQSISTLLIRNI